MRLKFKKLAQKAQLLLPAYKGDAGHDLFAVKFEIVNSNLVKFYTGIAIEIPQPDLIFLERGFKYVCKAYPRSSVKRFPLILSNCTGIIDEPYRGEITAFFRTTENLTLCELQKVCEKFMQDAILQLTFELVQANTELVEVDELSESSRGVKGYGSSNKK